ncbi:MAG TPA: hypothetical protein VNX28_12990 [Gemmataceae bacterium]|jgi:hypothetical protein|nr:hypothetical protein [Gemmataceae bacterium]
MLGIDKQGKLSELKKKLEEAINSGKVRSPITAAIRDVLAAINYGDHILLDSSLNALFGGLTSAARDIIRVGLAKSEATKKALLHAWRDFVDGHAYEDFDDLKDLFETFIDESIAEMTTTQRDIVLMLEKADYHVENAQQLEDGIRSMRKFRENILKEWPASGKNPSPINREAVDEARKAIAAGYKGLSKDQLVWGRALAHV